MKNYWLDKKKVTIEDAEKFRKSLFYCNDLSDVIKSKWDFQTAMGDKIKKQYEALYVHVFHSRKTK